MTRLGRLFAVLTADESGQDLVEYGIVVALIALASIVMMQGLASIIAATFDAIGAQINGVL